MNQIDYNIRLERKEDYRKVENLVREALPGNMRRRIAIWQRKRRRKPSTCSSRQKRNVSFRVSFSKKTKKRAAVQVLCCRLPIQRREEL